MRFFKTSVTATSDVVDEIRQEITTLNALVHGFVERIRYAEARATQAENEQSKYLHLSNKLGSLLGKVDSQLAGFERRLALLEARSKAKVKKR